MSIEKLDSSLSLVSIFRVLSQDPGTVFLDSSSMGYDLGRYSILACYPVKTFYATLKEAFFVEEGRRFYCDGDPFEMLREELCKTRLESEELVPFVGGAIGYISYDYWGLIEKRPRSQILDPDQPLVRFGFYDMALVFDHEADKSYFVGFDLYPGFESRKRKLLKLTESAGDRRLQREAFESDKPRSNFSTNEYFNAIGKARDYIREGEVYQINLSQRFSSSFNGSPASIYERLRKINPAPYSAYLNFGDECILSSSPERFMWLRNGVLETRPIKGTRPRGSSAEEERANCESLRSAEKDKAELLMIVDLERNDLGKVCKPGSITVEGLFSLETYAQVIHQTGRIRGNLASQFDAVDCLQAMFPGGSITGAPKIRAMEVIDELEPSTRGVYTGSIGYFGFDGNADFNIAIRTMRISEKTLSFNVGGGIVWDSDPKSEYEETFDKASALFEALGHSR